MRTSKVARDRPCVHVRFADMVESQPATRKRRGWDAQSAGVDRYVGLEHLDSYSLTIRRWGHPDSVGTNSDLRHFEPGDVILARRGIDLRKVGLAEFRGVASGHALVFRARPEVVLPEFLPFFLQSDAFMHRADRLSRGSLSKTVNLASLLEEEFALPPFKEQRRMASLLQAIESALLRHDDLSNNAFALWRSLSHAEHSNRAGRGSTLDEHFDIANGQVDPRDIEFAKLPLIAPNHIESERGRITKLESAEAQGAISGKYLFDEGVVLYSKIRPELRKATIAPCRGLCSADMYPLTPTDKLRAEYLLEILLSDAFSQFAISGSTRTGMPKVNRKHLALFRFDLPSTDEQDEYLRSASVLHAAMDDIAQRRTSLMSLKSIAFIQMGIA